MSDQPPPDVPAAGVQPLGYASPGTTPPRPRGWGCAGPTLAVLAVCVTGFIVLVPSMGRAREPANRIKCAANLKALAHHCVIFAQANGGRFPDSVGELMLKTDVTGELFVCPSSDAFRVGSSSTTWHTPEAEAAALDAATPGAPGGCQSYAYVGKGLTTASPATAVVAYEPPSNHDGKGGNVAYADGQVQWHDAPSLAKIIAAVRRGQNPPP